MSRPFLVAFITSLVILGGCKNDQTEPQNPRPEASSRLAQVELTVLVIDDAGLAAAVNLLRGEWAERSGGSIKLQEASVAELFAEDRPSADVVIYPTRLLPELVLSDWLRPVRQSVLDAEQFSYDDLLPLVRNEVMRYGGNVFGISLGEPPLLLAKRSGQREQETSNDLASADWLQLTAAQPASPDERNYLEEFLARAAAYTDPRQRDELLFAPDSMSPRLTAPPMIRALTMMAANESPSRDAADYQVACPTQRFLAGNQAFEFFALPAAEETYDLLRDKWEKSTQQENRLALIGFSGRMASVTASSRNTTSAFKLLSWLTSGTAAVQLSSRSRDTVWFRNSQSRKAGQWLKRPDTDRIEPIVTGLLSSDEHFLLPRIPGVDRYLEILASAVRETCEKGGESSQVLQTVGERWETLTEELGREQQKRSYRYHLGLDVWSK